MNMAIFRVSTIGDREGIVDRVAEGLRQLEANLPTRERKFLTRPGGAVVRFSGPVATLRQGLQGIAYVQQVRFD
jgi:hypothetical protein